MLLIQAITVYKPLALPVLISRNGEGLVLEMGCLIRLIVWRLILREMFLLLIKIMVLYKNSRLRGVGGFS